MTAIGHTIFSITGRLEDSPRRDGNSGDALADSPSSVPAAMDFARILEQSPRGVARSLQRHAADANQMFDPAGKGAGAERPNAPGMQSEATGTREVMPAKAQKAARAGGRPVETVRRGTIAPATLSKRQAQVSASHRLPPDEGRASAERNQAAISPPAKAHSQVAGRGIGSRVAAAGGSTIAVSAPLAAATPSIAFASPTSAAQRMGEFLAASPGGTAEGSMVATAGGPAGNEASARPRAGAENYRPQRLTPESRAAQERSVEEKSRFDDVLRSIHTQVGAKRSSARLRLEPPELGRIRVDVRIVGDRVSVDVQAETEAAKLRLARRAEELKSGLAEHGIRVERFEVFVNDAGRGADSTTWDWNGSGSGRHADARPRRGLPDAARERLEESPPPSDGATHFSAKFGVDLQI